MKLNRYKTILICTAITLVGCVQYDALPFEGKALPRKTDYGNDWLYYNLSKDEYLNPEVSGDSINGNIGVIVEGQQFNRTDWDIAFNRYNIRTNSGLSGSGLGGAYDMGVVHYDNILKVSQIPGDANFIVDVIYNITMTEQMWIEVYYEESGEPWFDPNSGPKQMESTANTLLGDALQFSGPPPSYTPSNHVYIIRTADGDAYYKLLIVSWYDQYKEVGERGGKISFKCDKLN